MRNEKEASNVELKVILNTKNDAILLAEIARWIAVREFIRFKSKQFSFSHVKKLSSVTVVAASAGNLLDSLTIS